DAVYQHNQAEVNQVLSEHAQTVYDAREAELGEEQMRTLERLLLLRAIDTHWVQHLTTMENLRTGIGLQAYGQRDPLVMYRTQGHQMFEELTGRMQHDVVHTLFHVVLTQQPPDNGGRKPSPVKKPDPVSPMEAVNPKNRDKVAVAPGKVGRNDPCPCGSGKKYKQCHGKVG
ncbi:MAG: SEC-C domain-containing protein, partial [Planctomycetes bacterium]|nr:SEC-C domain-containing protein [Planctomycetota bacterium]